MRLPLISPVPKFSDWFLRIKESSSAGKWQEVLTQYHELKKSGVQLTNPSFFHPILKACSILSFGHGKSIHASLIKLGFESFTSIGNSIVDFYAKAGDLDSATHVFDCMKSRDLVSWNIMVYGHLDQGDFHKGLQYFFQARVARFEPNTSTLVLVVQAFQKLGTVHDKLKIHGYLIRTGFWTIVSVQNSLLSMYVDIGMDLAENLFDEMCSRDVISWSVMIGCYVQNHEAQIALRLFGEMNLDDGIQMDGQITVTILKACTILGYLSTGRLIHGIIICKGLDHDIFVGNSLVDMYSKSNDANSAFRVFDEMHVKNVVSWNSMLYGFLRSGKHLEALALFDSMQEENIEIDAITLVNLLQICKHFGDPHQCKLIHCVIIRRGYEINELLINSLLDAYAKCDLISLAWKLFSLLKTRDAVTWSVMISGMPDKAIQVFREMIQANQAPNAVTILNLLEACSNSAELKTLKWAHAIAIRQGLASEVEVGTAVLDMYSKCGAIEASRKAFNQIHSKNVVSWSAMIAAYGMNGLANDAVSLLKEMRLQGLKPNQVTALSVLSACSHGGLVDDGIRFFKDLVSDNEVELTLEHCACMVDLLGRAGKVDTALELIKRMPNPGASTWGAFLSACRSYGNEELGVKAVSPVLELEPLNSAGYMLASSMYAAGGSWVEAARMRRMVRERGVRVVAGYSLVYVHNRPFRFIAGDKQDYLSDDLCLLVEHLHSCMKMDKKKFEIVLE